MARDKNPKTPAIRALDRAGVAYTLHPYAYEARGGAPDAAEKLNAPGHEVVKTLVFEDEAKRPLLVLMHGDREVSAKNLARHLGVKAVKPCDPDTANRHTGYQVGGISPLGTRKNLPVYMEKSILDLDRVYVNAGKRGLLARLSSRDLAKAAGAKAVSVSA